MVEHADYDCPLIHTHTHADTSLEAETLTGENVVKRTHARAHKVYTVYVFTRKHTHTHQGEAVRARIQEAGGASDPKQLIQRLRI